MDLLVDTGFLIDLWREQGKDGPASRFARTHADKALGICWVVAGEFLSGATAAGHDTTMVTEFLDRCTLVQSDTETIGHYAQIFAALRKQNAVIGPNDLWIAASARAHNLPIVTRNAEEFKRVPDLLVVDYRKND